MNSGPGTCSGTYVLVLRSKAGGQVQVGRWGELVLRKGYYLYVGSAFGPGGVRARVYRHCRADKRMHWHIDYLRARTVLESVWYSHDPSRMEHRWAASLASLSEAEPVLGFGCSDCRCESHLYFLPGKPALAEFARSIGCEVKKWSCTWFGVKP